MDPRKKELVLNDSAHGPKFPSVKDEEGQIIDATAKTALPEYVGKGKPDQHYKMLIHLMVRF